MALNIDVAKLDRWRQFIGREIMQLREKGAKWAHDKADTMAEINEFLRQVREDKQMTGLGGKRLE